MERQAIDAEATIRSVVGEMTSRFPTLDPSQIDSVVRRHVEQLALAPVTSFVPVLSERYAREELEQIRRSPTLGDAPAMISV